MIPKFAIDYVPLPRHRDLLVTHRTDDPVHAEEFLMHLLAAGAHIRAIRHEGVEIHRTQFDQMLKVAAERLASQMLCQSLDIEVAECRHRFKLAA